MTKQIQTSLYIADASVLKKREHYDCIYSQVTDERRARTDRLNSDRERRSSLAVEYMLLYDLEKRGITRDEVCYRYNQYGKPYLADEPEVYFSLSHSEDYGICAVSGAEIGCDIEDIKAPNLALAKRCFHPDEYALLQAQPDEDALQDMFYRLWTLKESCIKATGKGMTQPLSSFCIRYREDGSICPIEYEGETYYLREIDVGSDYRCSLCGRREDIRFLPEAPTWIRL